MSEFDFEMRLCAWLEGCGHPESISIARDAVVARQIGGGVHDPGARVIDTVLLEPGTGFEQRAAITPETIPDAAVEADVPTGQAVSRREAFAGLDIPPERQRELVERAADIGFFERERHGGREYIRRAARYPDWYGDLIAIENKPDLAKPGDLDRQLRFDVALSVFDRVVLATESHVTRGHLARLPDVVGVWRFHTGSIEVIRTAGSLDTSAPGTEVLEECAGQTRITTVSAGEKARRRRRIAERAYGKGFRTYRFPDCGRIEAADRHGADGLPRCAFYDRLVDPASECGPECPGHAPAKAPAVDLDAARARNSPWVPNPEGGARTQSELDRF